MLKAKSYSLKFGKKTQHQNKPQKNDIGKHLKELFATIPYNIVMCPIPLQTRAEQINSKYVLPSIFTQIFSISVTPVKFYFWARLHF